jgi:glucose-6-phosphate 1-epimerase
MTAIAMVDYGSLPAVQITAPDGAEAIVTLYGAHLVSWNPGEGERLFCSRRSAIDGSRPIRGGVPVIFPQFAERGRGIRHGFARISNWRMTHSGLTEGAAFARFTLTRADLPQALLRSWPHDFVLTLRVTVRGPELRIGLDVHNNAPESFEFSSALHTYFKVEDLNAIRIGGLREGSLRIEDKIDQIFSRVEGPVTLEDGETTLTLSQTGFRDMVVWNPGAADAAALSDLEDEEYRRFVCVEAALIEPYEIEPGTAWHGEHVITVA